MNAVKNLYDQKFHILPVSKNKRKSLWAACIQGSSSPLQNGPACVLDLQAAYWCQAREHCCSLHPAWVQVTQTGHPHDGALVKELHLNCLRLVCDLSHLPISWDFNIFFNMSSYLYAFDVSFSWCLISLHCRAFSSVCLKCESRNRHSPALPDYTALGCAQQPDLI